MEASERRTNVNGRLRLLLAVLLLALAALLAPATPAAAGASGSVVAWGSNTSGQTTVPVGLSNIAAIAAGFDHAGAQE